ncbi:hypothetical protein [Paenibacillus harenae]|nr:hypothetical protein [Paenibacillus harenae]
MEKLIPAVSQKMLIPVRSDVCLGRKS